MSSSVSARFPSLPLSEKTADRTPVSIEQLPPEIETSDDLLMARVQTDDMEALALLFQRYRNMVRAVSFRILRDMAESEDLIQDLFLFIQRKRAIFDGSKSSVRSWIVQMAYQRAIERRRRLVARQFYAHEGIQGKASEVVGTATTESDYSADAVFGRNGLEKVMEALSEDQRETLRLHFFDGYTLAEVSEKLGQPHGNVRHHYYRGLAQLRKQMSGSNVRVAEQYGK